MKTINNNFRVVFYYILPTLVILILLWYFLKIDLNSEEDKINLELEILYELKYESKQLLSPEKNSFKIYSSHLLQLLSLDYLKKSFEVNSVIDLNEKCLNNDVLVSNERNILQSYKKLNSIKNEYFVNHKKDLFKKLAVITLFIVGLLVLIFFRKTKSQKIIRYYVLLFLLLNFIGYQNYYKQIEALEEKLLQCVLM